MNIYWILCEYFIYVYIFFSFMRWDKGVMCVHAQSCLTLWFSRQEYQSGLPFLPLQGIFTTQGSNLQLLHWQVYSLPLSHRKPWKSVTQFGWIFKESAHVCSVGSESLQPHGLYSTRLLYPWNFPSKNTGMGCHFLLWGIFQPRDWTRVSRQVDSLPLHHLGSIIYIYIYMYTTHTQPVYIYIYTHTFPSVFYER